MRGRNPCTGRLPSSKEGSVNEKQNISGIDPTWVRSRRNIRDLHHHGTSCASRTSCRVSYGKMGSSAHPGAAHKLSHFGESHTDQVLTIESRPEGADALCGNAPRRNQTKEHVNGDDDSW